MRLRGVDADDVTVAVSGILMATAGSKDRDRPAGCSRFSPRD